MAVETLAMEPVMEPLVETIAPVRRIHVAARWLLDADVPAHRHSVFSCLTSLKLLMSS